MAESENILPNSFKSINDAVATAAKIRRSSILVQDSSLQWKVLILNNRYKILNDLQNIDLADNDGFVHINDNFGTVKRSKSQLNTDDILYFAKLISDYNSVDSPFTEMFRQIADTARKFITQKKPENQEADELLDALGNRSGVYETGIREFFCYFKRFIPISLVIEQEVDNEKYTDFSIHITINDERALEAVSPSFRKAKRSFDDVKEHISKRRPVELKLNLRENVLNIVRYQMFQIPVVEELMALRNPLNKEIFTDISNYDLTDVKLL